MSEDNPSEQTIRQALPPEQVQAMLDAVEASYAARGSQPVSQEMRMIEWAADQGNERAIALLAKITANPLIVLTAEQDAERNLRAKELDDWPGDEESTDAT